MNLPDRIVSYLHARMHERRSPLCLQLSADNRLVEIWGDAEHYGLQAIRRGDEVTQAIPVLSGCAPDELTELPFITDDRGHSYHLHLVPDGDARFVVLLDAKDELRERQRYQQTTNEVKLLLERERRLIAELVDAQSELAVRRKKAEDESRRRGEYIATMSHEFRTPLTTILSLGRRLAGESSSPETAELGRSILRITHNQLWLIDNLLSSARLDAEGFAIHRTVVDVRGLVDELSLVFAPLAADKVLSFGAWVAQGVPEFLMLDELHVRQVLVNLLGNAIKYTNRGSVALEIEHLDDRLSVGVTDTGPGIPDEDREAIFAPFNRGREIPRAPGAGLGLGLVRQLVDAMGGTLELESAVGEGTRVVFELAADAPSDSAETSGRGEGRMIVIGEDDPDIRDLLEARLREAGYRIECVEDGEALVETALALKPSLVLLDVNMPRLDGPAAARRLRERGFLAPILALSGASRRQDIEYALASGCTEFLRKPPHLSSLKRLIERLMLTDCHGSSAGTPAAGRERKQM